MNRLGRDRPALFAAIDLGASSARMAAGRLEGGRLEMREVTRLSNGPVPLPDGLHWDLLRIHHGMLEALGRLSREASDAELWVGIDSWGVDYGLLDAEGHLLGPPFHYRDSRTDGQLAVLGSLVALARVYQATGIQEMAINTICQLLVERSSAAYSVASHLLLVPDLLAYLLTGERRFERTNASTTQLVDSRTGQLVDWLFPLLDIRRDLFPSPVQPGEIYGPALGAVVSTVGIPFPPTVVAVASHDTASAVLAVPASTVNFAYVVSGTWSLVGLELEAPLISDATRAANFSNELGYANTVRFLKNVMGFWMLQECERSWALEGDPANVVELLPAVEGCTPFRSLVDTADAAFAVPGDMPARIREACARRGEPVPATRAEMVRCVLDSMALAIADALAEAQACSARVVEVLHVVGGGSSNRCLLSLLAAVTGLDVVAGPAEASAIGNLLVQFQAAGLIAGREEMRALVGRSFPLVLAHPDPALARAAAGARARWRPSAAQPLLETAKGPG
ncbi:MAG TPA: rhamnulokinase family protein [Acidimicrobiales bacterium]|nr:rhamnulokinase family protein [Acidimicrobiales bacterium]